jgi:hypothetical protein
VASCGCGANCTAGGPDPDRQAFTSWRGQSLRLRCPTAGDGSVGPRPKIAMVERREGSRSHRDGSAPRKRGRRASHARQNERVRLSALHPPLVRGEVRTRGHEANGADRMSKGTGRMDHAMTRARVDTDGGGGAMARRGSPVRRQRQRTLVAMTRPRSCERSRPRRGQVAPWRPGPDSPRNTGVTKMMDVGGIRAGPPSIPRFAA